MNWFPLFVRTDEMNCLIVGGGKVALHKLNALQSGQFHITVVAPAILPEIMDFPVEIRQKQVTEQDLEGVDFVIDATGDAAVGDWMYTQCTQRKILLNVVDCPEKCNCIFPAVLHRGKLTAAISTAGASPVAAAWVRDQLDALLPDYFEDLLLQLERLRPIAKQTFATQSQRAHFFRQCFSTAIAKGGILSQDELEVLWTETK